MTAGRGESEPVTAYDSRELERLGLSPAALLDHRDRNPLPIRLDRFLDLRMERIADSVDLIRLLVEVPASDTGEAYTLAASINPANLLAVTERSRGFKAVLFDQDGRAIFTPGSDAGEETSEWIANLDRTSAAARSTTVEFTENGVPMIGAYAPFADGALWAAIQIPSSVVYLTARELLSDARKSLRCGPESRQGRLRGERHAAVGR